MDENGEDHVSDDITKAVARGNLKALADVGATQLLSVANELILNAQQMRAQQEERHSIRIENARTLSTIALKLLDPDATEIASQAMSTASALGAQTSADTKTLSNMTASMNQMSQTLAQILAVLNASSDTA